MIDSFEVSPKRYFVTKRVMPSLASEICEKICEGERERALHGAGWSCYLPFRSMNILQQMLKVEREISPLQQRVAPYENQPR